MITFGNTIIIELIIGTILWWVGIYLFTQNPFSRIVQLTSGFLVTISFYFTADLLLYAAAQTFQYSFEITILRLLSFSMYLPIAFLYHASSLIVKDKNQTWHSIKLALVYSFAFILIALEGFTNLIRYFPGFLSSGFNGDLANAIGPYFWLIGVFIILTLTMTAVNFYKIMLSQRKYSPSWWKYSIPFWGVILGTVMGPFVMLGYYQIIPHLTILPLIDFALIVLPLAFSIIKYNLFLDDTKIFFGKTFYYSSITSALILAFYLLIVRLTSEPFNSVYSLVLPFILIYCITASHPIYEWFLGLIRDLIYSLPSGYTIVSDEEVVQATRDYNRPERLEDSQFLRLKIIDEYIRSEKSSKPVDALREVIDDAIEYFEPKEEDRHRRIKSTLKYHLMKMLKEECEEGQILWELGFEEYPTRILSKEGDSRKPLFTLSSPSDYYPTSRNAFIALKKEAIHSLAWRISYLEKTSIKSRK